MTSEERYQHLLEMDRLGLTTGRDQRLLASIAAGETSIADAFPVYVPQPGSEMMTFGGSTTTPAAASSAPASSSAASTPAAQQETVTQQEQFDTSTLTPEELDLLLNNNFMQFIQQLGLMNLFNAYSQQPQAAQTAPAARGMLGGPQFGIAPIRTGYLPPLIVNPASISEETGLLQYIQNQGQ